MKQNPFFSIIIPIYKVEKYLAECVDSVLEQTFLNYEIILVDDGSPDNCPKICDEYAEKNECIRVLHKENGGLSDARNEGIKAACGEFVIFLDSDDKLAKKNVLTELTSFIKNENAKLVFCPRLARFSEKVEPVFAKYIQTEKLTPIQLFDYVQPCGSLFAACLFVPNRHVLLEHNLFFTKGLLHEDMDWIPRLLTATDEMVSVFPREFYLYRFNDESITSVFTQKRFEGFLYTIKWISELSEFSEFLQKWINMLFYTLFINLESELSNKSLYKSHLKELQKYMKKEKEYLSSRNKLILHLNKAGACLFYKFRGLVK